MAAIASPTSGNMPWERLEPVAGGPGLSPDGFAGQSLARNQSIAVGADYVLRPDLLIDFRFGFFRYHVNVLPNDMGTTPAKDAGIPGLNLGDTLTSGMPFVFVDGQAGDQFSFGHLCGCPLLENEQQFQWVTNWTKTAGNHVFKWGADFRYAQNLRVASDDSRTGSLGFFQFADPGAERRRLGFGHIPARRRERDSAALQVALTMPENVRSAGSSMARTPFGSPANWYSTMDCDGIFIFRNR